MIRLECTIGGHNKFYEFHGTEAKGRFTVKGMYGRIGGAPSHATIYDGDNKDEANQAFRKKVEEKKKKGYVMVSNDGVPVPKTQPSEKKTVIFQ